MRAVARFALWTLLAAAAGCDAKTQAPGQGQLNALPGDAHLVEAEFARADVRLTVAHTGVRRLEFSPASGPRVSYRERISTDGQGRYSVEPVELLESAGLDWGGFELLQRAREGFLFRYRDFVVRDRGLFVRNWSTVDLGRAEQPVAGRVCERYRVERKIGVPVQYELSVDVSTDLILACQEFDGSGGLVASMTYEDVQFDPDVHAVLWHRPGNAEQLLHPTQGLGAELGEQVIEPRVLPPGYALRETATIEDGQGRRWIKLTYVDGVDPLFFFQELTAAPDSGKPGRVDDVVAGIVPRSASSVLVFQVGSTTVIQGTVEGFAVMVIGKARQAELLDLIESALP